MKNNKYLITLLLIISFILLTDDVIASELQSKLAIYSNEIDPEAVILLNDFAKRVNTLNQIELRQAAVIAAINEQWDITGFYYIATTIQSKVIKNGFNLTLENYIEFDNNSQKKKNSSVLSLINIKRYSVLFERVIDDPGEYGILYDLLSNFEDLKRSFQLYKLWSPEYPKDFDPLYTYKNRGANTEIKSLFNELNSDLLETNESLLKLLSNDEYRSYKLQQIQTLSKLVSCNFPKKGSNLNCSDIDTSTDFSNILEDLETSILEDDEFVLGWWYW